MAAKLNYRQIICTLTIIQAQKSGRVVSKSSLTSSATFALL